MSSSDKKKTNGNRKDNPYVLSKMKFFEDKGSIRNPVYSALYFKEQGRIVQGTKHGNIIIFDFNTEKCLKNDKVHLGIINHLLKWDENLFISTCYGKKMFVWSINTMNIQREITCLQQYNVDQMKKLTEKEFLCIPNSQAQQGHMFLIDFSSGSIKKKFDGYRTHHDVKIIKSRFFPNSFYLNTFESEGRIVLYNYENEGKQIKEFNSHKRKIYSLSILQNRDKQELLICYGLLSGYCIYNTVLEPSDLKYYTFIKFVLPDPILGIATDTGFSSEVYANRFLFFGNINGGIKLFDFVQDPTKLVLHETIHPKMCIFEIKPINEIISEKAIELMTCSSEGAVRITKISNILIQDKTYEEKDLKERVDYLINDFWENCEDSKIKIFLELKTSGMSIQILKILL